MTTFTEEDLALMTPAEREAVTTDDDNADLATVEELTSEDSPQEDAPKAEVKPEAPEAESDDTPKAVYVAPGVEDYDTKLAAAEARKDEAFKKMMDGELSDSEYRAVEKEVSAEIRKLDRDMAKAEISEEMNQQASRNAWHEYVTAQVDSEKKAGADFTAKPELMNELDRTVKLLAAQVQQDPSMVKHLSPTRPGALITNVDKWILNESIAIVKARNRMVEAAPAKKPGREPDLSGVPPTLSKVPVAAEASTGGDEFAYMRNLTGSEYEKALMKLSADQLDRYMA